MDDYSNLEGDTLQSWVMSKVDEWENHYCSNYEERHKVGEITLRGQLINIRKGINVVIMSQFVWELIKLIKEWVVPIPSV